MPRRKNPDSEASGQPVKQPRVRKKKEPSSICSTPTTEHPPAGMKLEMVHSMPGMPPGCGPGGPMESMMMGGPQMHMQHLSNGTPCGPAPHHQQIMEEGSNGPGGMGPPFGGGLPHPHQGPPFEFYQQGPTTAGGPAPPPQFIPPPMPMFSGGPPPGHPQMMMQQQSGQGPPQMGPVGVGPVQQFHPGPEDGQPHPQQQMMPPMHPHHPNAQPGPGPMSAPPGPPQMPSHQMPPPPHPMFPPGGFPRQPPGLMLLPPPSIPQPPFLEFRLHEMNRRLYQFHYQFYQQAPSEQTEQWWDAFSQEFFDDMGRITLCMHEYSIEQGGFVLKQYAIARRLIPRFYRSLFTNGVSSLHYIMRSPAQEMVDPQRMQNPEMFGCCALNCENLLMVISYDKPIQAEVHIECRLYVEFAPFNPNLGYRVRHWFMEMRTHQEFVGKDGMQMQHMDGIEKKHLTSYGLPFPTHNQLRMWQIVQRMEPIVERSKDTNESPQLALHQIVTENGQRMEMERQQRMAQAAAAAHIQSPSQHNQPGGSVNGPPQHPMAAIMSGMGPPQIPPGLPPGLLQSPQMGPPMGVPPQPQAPPAAEEQKPQKPKRIRQRKTAAQQQQAAAAAAAAAGAAAAGCGGNSNNNNASPPKGKKGGQQAAASAAQNAGQQTPPAGMPPMPSGFPQMGGPPPGQFHQMGMPPGQYHHDVLTVGEPSMMGCEYGEQDERQISRVENTAFAGLNHHPSVSQGGNSLMMGPPGSCGPSIPSQSGGSQMTMASSLQMGENSQSMLNDFMHSQQQQPQQLHLQQQQSLQMQPPTSMWGPPPSDSSQQAMSSGS